MAKKTETIGSRLSRARTDKGLTRAALAAEAGLDRGAIRLIEEGKRKNPQVDTVALLARILGVTTDWLISGIAPGVVSESQRAAG